MTDTDDELHYLNGFRDGMLEAARLLLADRYDKRFGWETPMGEQMRAAARMIGDTP